MYTFQSPLCKKNNTEIWRQTDLAFKSLFPAAYQLYATAKSWVNDLTSLSLNFPSVTWGHYHLCHRCSYKKKQKHSHPQLEHGTFYQVPSHAFSPPTLPLRSLFWIFLTRFPDSIHYMNSSQISLSNCIRKTTHLTSIAPFWSCLWESALYLPHQHTQEQAVTTFSPYPVFRGHASLLLSSPIHTLWSR